jgi:hypothetical protein
VCAQGVTWVILLQLVRTRALHALLANGLIRRMMQQGDMDVLRTVLGGRMLESLLQTSLLHHLTQLQPRKPLPPKPRGRESALRPVAVPAS